MMKPAARAPTRIRSVRKADSILVWLAGQPEARSAKQIATALGFPIATAYHLLDTLVEDGMLFKDEHRLYHLGPSVGSAGRCVPAPELAARSTCSHRCGGWRRTSARRPI